jgi:SH3-like domain-containing protein
VIRRFVFALFAVSLAAPAHAGHYASLRSNRVYLREGPTFQNRVLFVYQRKDYPVEVLASYETWRRVRDPDGTIGWVSQTMLSDVRTVIITGQGRAEIRDAPYAAGGVIAKADPGVVGRLKACKPQYCEIVADGLKGWIDRTRIWGVDAGEVIE